MSKLACAVEDERRALVGRQVGGRDVVVVDPLGRGNVAGREDVLGCPTVISTVNDPSLRAPRLKTILEWAGTGRIRPYVSHVFPIAQFREAMRAKWNGEVTGGCVLHP